jgi:hypothetical protein
MRCAAAKVAVALLNEAAALREAIGIAEAQGAVAFLREAEALRQTAVQRV